jgi:hypothetical protein
MKENYKKYGDCLSLELISLNLSKDKQMINSAHNVCVFFTQDTNLRLLLVGIAILGEDNVESLASVLGMFFKQYGKQP